MTTSFASRPAPREIGSRVEIDMESTAYTDRTLALVTAVAREVGDIRLAIQAYLYRSTGRYRPPEPARHPRAPVQGRLQ